MNISEFHTTSHSTAKKMPLFTIDGKKTTEFIMILGMDSPQVRAAKAECYRIILAAEDKEAARMEGANKWKAAMIDSWSFPEECTEDEKIDLLTKAPFIGDAIDIFSATFGNFKQKK